MSMLKLFSIAVVAGACFIASVAVMALVEEREGRGEEAKQEIAALWSGEQTVMGPMLVARSFVAGVPTEHYVLPDTLHFETELVPEERARGIFKTTVYTSVIKVSGEFKRADILGELPQGAPPVFVVGITDTRGIEKQFDLAWGGSTIPFEPGPGVEMHGTSGLHAEVTVPPVATIPFSFEVALKGSESMMVAPVGRESTIVMASAWPTPKFTGSFLPSTRTVTEEGFESEWRISSFGRAYPQSWTGYEVDIEQIKASVAGVELVSPIDGYDMVSRSVKYAILFIAVTFAAFFLFDVLAAIRVHPIQYLLIGAALALFYLLLLSLMEQIGFAAAYALGAVMIVGLITAYSRYVLKSLRRALPIGFLLALLYGYLYFVLQLEDYALLFGSLLLFVLLGIVMFSTRHIDWNAEEKK